MILPNCSNLRGVAISVSLQIRKDEEVGLVHRQINGVWSTSAKPYFVHLRQKIHFCLKWSKRVGMGPKGSHVVANTWVGHFGPFWATLERKEACYVWPFLVLNVQNGLFLGHPQSRTMDPKAYHQISSMCGLLEEPKNTCLGHKYGRDVHTGWFF